jgi:hypothetical protein
MYRDFLLPQLADELVAMGFRVAHCAVRGRWDLLPITSKRCAYLQDEYLKGMENP